MIENATPCPFCGSTKINFIEVGLDGDSDNYQILCDGCGTTTGGYATKEKAIAFWNTRHELNSTFVKNGKNKHNDQKYLCKKCGASFTDSDRKVGRPCLFDKPLTDAEKTARNRAKKVKP